MTALSSKSPMPNNYLFLLTDSNWGHNDSYYPSSHQFKASNLEEIIMKVSQAIYMDAYDDGSNDDIVDLFNLQNKKDHYTVEDIVSFFNVSTIKEFTKWINGRDWHAGQLFFTRDNNHVYDKLVKAGMPIDNTC